MDFEQFKQDYPSAVEQDRAITLSELDYTKLLVAIGTVAPENVRTFYYRGYVIEKAATTAKKEA